MSEAVDLNPKKDEIIVNIRNFIIDNFLFGNESEVINDYDSFMGKDIINSTGILELIEYVEERYDISIGDDEVVPENLDSLNNISSFILLKKGV